MTVTPGSVLLLVTAGMIAGAVNAAAGGGSLISFPALLLVGLPALSANVTNAVALCPGYLGGVSGFRSDLKGQRDRMRRTGLAALVGTVVGVGALQVSSGDTFELVVPYLLLLGCGLLAFQPPLSRWVQERRAEDHHGHGTLWLAVFAAGAYGAYFGAALGVMLLAILGVLVADTLARLNALKAYLSLLVNALAACLFIVVAPVSWTAVLIMAPSTLAGGRLGATLARRIPANVLRTTVAVMGVTVAISMLVPG